MINRYTVKRIAVDYYTIDQHELMVTPKGIKWDFVSSIGDNWPEYHLPEQAQARNPRQLLKKDGEKYTFYACVYYFPEPRLMGKWKDYTSAYGWEE